MPRSRRKKKQNAEHQPERYFDCQKYRQCLNEYALRNAQVLDCTKCGYYQQRTMINVLFEGKT